MVAKKNGRIGVDYEKEFSSFDTLKNKAVFGIPRGLTVQSKNNSQTELIKSILNNDITICEGRPGSGKTFTALGMALSLLQNDKTPYVRALLFKSIKQLSGEEIGLIKGDVKDKLSPAMESYYDNLEILVSKDKADKLVNDDVIRFGAIAFLKGRSIPNSIIIVDEIENVDISIARTILTRIGMNSKMILLGDVNQCDLKDKSKNALSALIDMLKDIDGIGIVKMDRNDKNIRNPIIDVIEERFEIYDEEQSKTIKNNKSPKKEPLND